jgi:hypothetical protein
MRVLSIAGLAAVLTACGLDAGGRCQTNTECTLCVRMEGCGFCLETNECLDRDLVCPGDWAFTEDQCVAHEIAPTTTESPEQCDAAAR